MAKSSIRLARRYARALFESCELTQLEPTRDALNSVAAVWRASAELRDALLNPAVPLDQRVAVMVDIAAKVRPGDDRFRNFINLVSINGRIEAVDEIARAFTAIVDAAKKILAVEIHSAREVSSAEQQSLQQQLQAELGSMASVQWSVDAQLLGGLTVKAGDRLLDGSVRGALERLRSELRA